MYQGGKCRGRGYGHSGAWLTLSSQQANHHRDPQRRGGLGWSFIGFSMAPWREAWSLPTTALDPFLSPYKKTPGVFR